MAEYLTKEEYKVLQSDLSTGVARLVVTRSLARHFFINVTNRNIKDLTGASVLGEKLQVLALLVTSFILIIACLGLTAKEYGWTAMFAIPLFGIFWTIIVGFTTESGSMLFTTVLFIPCLLLTYFLPGAYGWLFGDFVASIYCYRIAHMIAQKYLITLISSSYDAYDMLSEQIKVTRDVL
jgi:hypothetical protein